MANPASSEESPLPLGAPMLLSFVAGYVDSYTYLALFGLFAAQVTGSFVIAGAEFMTHDYGIAGKLLAIVTFIFAGQRRPRWSSWHAKPAARPLRICSPSKPCCWRSSPP